MAGSTIRAAVHGVNTLGTVERETRDDRARGERLRSYLDGFYPRRAGGIAKLAEDAGVRRGTMYDWFKGRAQPDIESLRAIAGAVRRPLWEVVAAMDGELPDVRRRIAEEVEAAVGPLRALLRDAGLLRGETARDGATHAEPRSGHPERVGNGPGS
jgi:transcriptional regulator with XRE-family HTH domain